MSSAKSKKPIMVICWSAAGAREKLKQLNIKPFSDMLHYSHKKKEALAHDGVYVDLRVGSAEYSIMFAADQCLKIAERKGRLIDINKMKLMLDVWASKKKQQTK